MIESRLLEYAIGILVCFLMVIALITAGFFFHTQSELYRLRDDMYYHRKIVRRLMEHIGIKSVLDVDQKQKEDKK